jgi:HTH-like domain
MAHQLPVATVCRVLGTPRSSVYARRGRSGMPARSGPATAISDQELVELIRQVLEDSPFAGEGYRKVRARLRREHGVHVSGKRVLRLLRREGLLAPQRVRGRRKPRPHDGTIIPRRPTSAGVPMRPWPGPVPTGGSGSLPAWITTPPRPGRTWPRSVTGSPPSSRSTTRSSTAGVSSAQTSPAVWSCATTGARNTVGPLRRLAGVVGDHRQPGVPGRAGDQRLR